MFKNLIEATEFFSNKQVCIDYLTRIRWNGNVTCVHCNHDKVYMLKGANRRYKCAGCRKQFSAIKGSIFENSPISLQKWFVAIYILTSHKKGISSVQLAKDIGVTQKTAWFMAHRIRFAIQTRSFTVAANSAVEVDETYVGGKRKNKHGWERQALKEKHGPGFGEKTPVFGLMERNGRVVAMKVQNASGNILKPIIREIVEQGATLLSDGHQGYKDLNAEYNHVVVNHEKGIYVVNKTFHTNNIENFWSLLKRGIIGIYHSVSVKHLDAYIDEFEFRYNTKTFSENERFENMLSLSNKRLTYQTLTCQTQAN